MNKFSYLIAVSLVLLVCLSFSAVHAQDDISLDAIQNAAENADDTNAVIMDELVIKNTIQTDEPVGQNPNGQYGLSKNREETPFMDEYLDEADEYFRECSNNYLMMQYYNCACLSAEYLNKRIEGGPTINTTQIRLNIQDKCHDSYVASGEVYRNCLQTNGQMAPGTDPEKLCECVANTYVRYMDTVKPNISSNTIVRFQAMAYTTCQNPHLPKPELIRPR